MQTETKKKSRVAILIKQTKNLIKKQVKDLNRHFFQRKHTDDQQVYEKMLNIINHYENANQNHNEMSPHTCYNGCFQLEKKFKFW